MPQDVPVRVEVLLLPDDQQRLADLRRRTGHDQDRVMRDALRAYLHARRLGDELREHAIGDGPSRDVDHQSLPLTGDRTRVHES